MLPVFSAVAEGEGPKKEKGEEAREGLWVRCCK